MSQLFEALKTTFPQYITDDDKQLSPSDLLEMVYDRRKEDTATLLKEFSLSVQVTVDLRFVNAAEATAWAQEHTVFDMLDKGGRVSEIEIYHDGLVSPA
jgi:hypothetical protein